MVEISNDFKAWLRLQEGGVGSGTKRSIHGLNAGGQAQGGRGMFKPAKPQSKVSAIMNKK